MAASDGGAALLNFNTLSAKEARTHPALQGMAGLEDIRGTMSFTEYQYHWPERIVVETVMKARAIGMEALNHTAVTGLARERTLADDAEGRWPVARRSGSRGCQLCRCLDR